MHRKGLTLIELLITLAIASILLTVAVPSFAVWVQKSQLRTAAYDLLKDIHKTREEAVKRHARVTLWNSDNDWDTGRVLFVDDNEDGQHGSGETLLFDRAEVAGDIQITGNGPLSTMISYNANGESMLAGGGFQAGTLTLCAKDLDTAYQITISPGGRPRMTSEADSSAVCP